ncbi:MAG: hypothetical protein A3E88_01290 [Legionellales bacterium RIFCSPHIGHO2_12_FULL_35_11]|nr:MAG: hypothetical protein A3E88_01290 [Legionellales bacterium RIFCSPHIGHO2_12_FULL_35_11]
MADQKSKIPDMNEITSMAGKLFKDVKASITSIISDYKANHPDAPAEESSEKSKEKNEEKVEVKSKSKTAEEDSAEKMADDDTK